MRSPAAQRPGQIALPAMWLELLHRPARRCPQRQFARAVRLTWREVFARARVRLLGDIDLALFQVADSRSSASIDQLDGVGAVEQPTPATVLATAWVILSDHVVEAARCAVCYPRYRPGRWPWVQQSSTSRLALGMTAARGVGVASSRPARFSDGARSAPEVLSSRI